MKELFERRVRNKNLYLVELKRVVDVDCKEKLRHLEEHLCWTIAKRDVPYYRFIDVFSRSEHETLLIPVKNIIFVNEFFPLSVITDQHQRYFRLSKLRQLLDEFNQKIKRNLEEKEQKEG